MECIRQLLIIHQDGMIRSYYLRARLNNRSQSLTSMKMTRSVVQILYLSLAQLIFRLIKSSSLIVVLTVHCLAVQTTGQEKDSSKSFPAHLKEISRRESKDKRVMIPEAVWKLSGIPKPYINDKFQNLYDTYDW